MRVAEAAQARPVVAHLGHAVQADLGVVLQLVPVHERAQVGVAHGAFDLEHARRLVAVVDLGLARCQQQLVRLLVRVRAHGVERVAVVVRIEVVQHRDALQRTVQQGRVLGEQRLVALARVGRQAEVDHAVEAVVVIIDLGAVVVGELAAVRDRVAIRFRDHEERLVADLLDALLAGRRPLPVLVGLARHLLEVLPHARFRVLDGVAAEAVEAVFAHPVGVPFHQVVARCARVARALEEVVQLLRFAVVAPFLLPLRDEERRQVDVRVAVGAEVGQVLHERAIDRALDVLEAAGRRRAHPVRRPHGVLRRDGSRVVHHDVEQHADAARMRRLDEVAHVLRGADVGVDGGEVARPVAVEAIADARALVGGRVDLFHRRRDPERVHAQVREIPFLDLGRDPGQVAAHEAARDGRIVLAAVGVVVRRIAVVEAVDHEEVDGRVIPGERLALDRRQVGRGRGGTEGKHQGGGENG